MCAREFLSRPLEEVIASIFSNLSSKLSITSLGQAPVFSLSSGMHTTVIYSTRQPRFATKYAIRANLWTSYPWIIVAWIIVLMTRGASAINSYNYTGLGPPVTITNDAQNPEDPYADGIFGIGFPVNCRQEYNAALDSSSEFDKVGAAVASTIMTLVPALLSFTPLPTAKIRSLILINTELAFFTAAMTLGLYNKGIITLAKSNILKVKDLCTDKIISLYGSPSAPTPDKALVITDLHGLYDPEEPTTGLTLGKINKMVLEDDRRHKRITIIAIVIAFSILQCALFGILIRILPMIDDIKFIWSCTWENVTELNLWLGVAAILSGILRTLAASRFFTEDEIFHLIPLPTPHNQPSLPSQYGCTKCLVLNVEHWELPTQTPKEHRSLRNIYFFIEDIKILFRKVNFRRGVGVKFIKHLRVVLKQLLSPRGMVVVVRPSNESHAHLHPILLVLSGYTQALLLVFFTFLFGSVWGGTLFLTLGFVVVFVSTITASRLLSLGLGSWIEGSLGIVDIEYENDIERSAITRIILAMPKVLVKSVTNNYMYSEGYRLDTRCGDEHGSIPPADTNTETLLWRAIGLVLGSFLGLVLGAFLGVVVYITTIPSYFPFFPTEYYVYTPLAIGIGACLIFSIVFGLKVRAEIGSSFLEDLEELQRAHLIP